MSSLLPIAAPGDPRAVYLETVLGPVPIDEIGVADAHAHLWIDPPEGVAKDARNELHDAPAIERELMAYGEAGGTLLVDCQPGGAGRDARQLRQLAEVTGLHVTTTTGFHLRKYYPPDYWLWKASADEAAQYFVDELTDGTFNPNDGERVRATTIKIGYTGTLDGQERTLMEAAADASWQTGAILLFHTEAGKNIEALIPFFEEFGIGPERLYLCHVDKRPDTGLHAELAQAGVLLGYDTFGRPKYDPEHNLWPLLKRMVEDGHAGQIALGLDFAAPDQWRFGGGPGVQMMIDVVIPRLREEGMDETAIAKLTGGNIARFLVRHEGVRGA